MNILHLEDNDMDGELVCEALRDQAVDYHVTRVETRKEFAEALEMQDWDIILGDYTLRSFDGMSALKLALEKRPGIPFIFVSGTLGEELAVEALRNGATDYVLKNRLHRLPQVIARAKQESDSREARREAERQLTAAVREKTVLIQEVHHRVKNNLQIICSLLNMQSTAIDDPILSSALRESQKRVESMAMVHKILYASNSLDEIDFGEYVRLLSTEVSGAYGVNPDRIRVIFDLAPVCLKIRQAIPCGLILNELLSNALKYAFPDNSCGEIRLSLHQTEDSIRLAVEDTGIGMQTSRSKVDSKSLGLSLVNILTRQLKGKMTITSSEGTQFVLEFARSDK